jgi:formate dehydrogenase major subunit
MAECHPVGFRWVMEARRRGATIIHVDPRFTRTSALADLHLPIRAGTDIVFLGGLIRYVIEHDRYFREYVVRYTNAATIISEKFSDTEDLDGIFSGWSTEKSRYEIDSWQYEGVRAVPAAGHHELFAEMGAGRTGDGLQGIGSEPRDETLQHPRCVFQIVKRHFARYTPSMVERACGIPRASFERVAKLLCDNSGRERTSAICYAVGWTQHTVGVQYIRAASILQLLLGNIGRPGGGILALRGHASIQGSTDIPTLYNLLPGYLPMPHVAHAQNLDEYLASNAARSGWWGEMPKYMVSLLKAWYGDHATRDTDYCFERIPHLTGDHSHMNTVAQMAEGNVRGYFVIGENPVVGSTHGGLQRKGLRQLDWLVVRDFAPTETAEFWRVAPEIERGEVRSADIDTEVFFFPAAAHTEKDGSFTNTQRLLQWHHKAIEPPGDCRSDLWFIYHLGRRLKELHRGSAEDKDRAIEMLTWSYPTEGPLEDPSAEAVLQEINGYRTADHETVGSFKDLTDDGSTACGCWIYSGCYAGGENQTARRKPGSQQSWVAPEWAWAWPANRRLLYNRASADPEGRPWSERKRYVWWDEDEAKWTGEDVPDFIADRPPSYRPPDGAEGKATIRGDTPFIMQADARGWLFAPSGLVDGPLPTHYEPQESVVENPLYVQQCNPARLEWRRRDNPYHRAWGDERFPHLLTTYRLTEHHTAGGMTRWLSWLCELQPEAFCEIGLELADQIGVDSGGWVTVSTARGEMECRALVTPRVKPLQLNRKRVHQIGVPYHWGHVGRSTGDSVNELLSFVADPNVHIQESKALTANIVAGRRSRGRRAATTADYPGGDSREVPRDLPGHGQRPAEPPIVKE